MKKILKSASLYFLFTIFLETVIVSGCASIDSAGKFQHGFDIKNIGSSFISEVVVQYGFFKRDFCREGCAAGGGTFYGVNMPIQEKMFVTWKTSDGVKHHANLVIKEKINYPNRLASLRLQFNEGELSILQYLRYTNPTLVGFERVPLYP